MSAEEKRVLAAVFTQVIHAVMIGVGTLLGVKIGLFLAMMR